MSQELPEAALVHLKNFIPITGGTFHIDEVVGSDTFSPLRNYHGILEHAMHSPSRGVVLPGFYLQKFEVTVEDYMEFYRISGDSANRPDTACFRNVLPPFCYNAAIYFYFWHPKFLNYPIVGVNLHQVKRYIKWKNEEVQKILGGTDFEVKFRLPTALEMEFVSTSWFDTVARASKKTKKTVRFNTDWDSDGYETTAPVHALPPNTAGLYNIAGNVAEWTQSQPYYFFPGEYEASFLPRNISPSTFRWTNDTCIEKTPYNINSLTVRDHTPCFNKRSAEVLKDSGYYITSGGSWFHPSFYTQPGAFIPVHQDDDFAWLGFRLVAEITMRKK